MDDRGGDGRDAPVGDAATGHRPGPDDGAPEADRPPAETALALARLEGALAEVAAVRALLEDTQQRLAASRRQLVEEREAARSRWDRLRTRATQEARKASGLLKDDPAAGLRRISRSAARRLKG